MRTTLALDDDVFLFARASAQRDKVSIGEAISRLARSGIQAQSQSLPALSKPRSKFALLDARDETITTEHVRKLMDQEGF